MLNRGWLTLLATAATLGGSGCASIAAQQEETAKSNTQVVLAFENMVFNQHQVAEGFEKYVGPTYKQHNPRVPDGKEGAVKALTYVVTTLYPNSKIVIKRTVAEGDLVAVHLFSDRKPGELRGAAIVDIFRLENGKIVEHWDVDQEVPEKSANDNTMF